MVNENSARCTRCNRHDRSPGFGSWICSMCSSQDGSDADRKIAVIRKQVDDLKRQAKIDAESAKQRELECSTHSGELNALRSRFGSLLASEFLFDLTIEVDGRNIRAHRCILASRSPVFAAMFASPCTESSTGILKLSDTNYDTVTVALHYIYTSEVRDNYAIKEEAKADALLYFAEKYDVQRMTEDIDKILTMVVNPKNAFRLFGLSLKFKLPHLEYTSAAIVQSELLTADVISGLREWFESGESGRKHEGASTTVMEK